MIKLPWKRGAKLHEPRLKVNPRLLELQTAKQILEEVFHARPSDIDEMIKMSLKRRTGERRAARRGAMAKRVRLGEWLWAGALKVSRALEWGPRRSRPDGSRRAGP